MRAACTNCSAREHAHGLRFERRWQTIEAPGGRTHSSSVVAVIHHLPPDIVAPCTPKCALEYRSICCCFLPRFVKASSRLPVGRRVPPRECQFCAGSSGAHRMGLEQRARRTAVAMVWPKAPACQSPHETGVRRCRPQRGVFPRSRCPHSGRPAKSGMMRVWGRAEPTRIPTTRHGSQLAKPVGEA